MAESEDPEQLDEEAIAAIMKRYGKTPQSVPGISSTYFNYLMVRIVFMLVACASHDLCT